MKNFENDHFINLIIEKVKKILSENKNQSIAHRWDHTDRVYKRSIEMAKYFPNEKIDMELLKISSLFHDINQPFNEKERHVKLSTNLTNRILKEINYPKDKIKKVLKIILEHSSEDENYPSSIESKILFDADKLDGIGAIGISRVFSLCGQNGLTPIQAIEWYKNKIDKARQQMQTDIGKEKAEIEMKYVLSFFEKFKSEEENIF